MANKEVWKKVARKYWVTQEKAQPPKRISKRWINTICHEVIPKTISPSHLLLKGFFISCFPWDLSLYLGYFISYLGGTPNRVGWRPSHTQTCQLTWGLGLLWCLKGILRWIILHGLYLKLQHTLHILRTNVSYELWLTMFYTLACFGCLWHGSCGMSRACTQDIVPLL